MAETLASTLNQPVDPFSIVGQVSKRPSITERGAAARGALEPTMRAQEAASAEARRLEREGAEKIAQGEVDLAQSDVRAIEGAQKAYKEQAGEAPIRNVQDFNPDAAMELAALTAIMGAFVGLSGGGGRGALTALEGMTTGYRQGKQELYERGIKDYEAELQAYKDRITNAKQTYDNVIKLETARKGAGAAELKKLQTQIAGTVGEAQAKAGNLSEVGKYLNEAIKAANQAESKLLTATATAERKEAKDAAETARTSKPAPYVAELNVPPSGVPTPPINPMAKAGSNKSYDARLATNLKAAESVLDRARKENDKNVEKSRQADLAEAALKRLVLKKFNEGKKKGQIPQNATLNLNDLSVNGANLPQVTGGVFGLPFIGDFFTKIKTTTDPDAADFQKEAANFQREAYVPGEGQISNFERELFRQASFDLGRPVLTNLAILQGTREAAKRQMQRMQFLEDYYAQNDTIVGAERLWQIYSENNRFLSIDPYGKVTFNPGTTHWKTWFRSKQGQSIDTLMPQQQTVTQPTQPSSSGLTEAEEARYQELLRKQRGGQ